jgi:hypothetical protein
MAYLVDDRVSEVLSENGIELVVHVPIVGAEAMMETIQGFNDIATNIGGQTKIRRFPRSRERRRTDRTDRA